MKPALYFTQTFTATGRLGVFFLFAGPILTAWAILFATPLGFWWTILLAGGSFLSLAALPMMLVGRSFTGQRTRIR